MLKNYFRTAWRNLLRNKVYSAINIAGLAIGISACVLIILYVQDELTYERHFDKKDRIVRVVSDMTNEGKGDKFSLTSYLLAPALAKDYPEIEKATRLMSAQKQTVWVNEQAFNEENLYFADSTFFDIFSYDFVKGDPKTALDQPKSIVITEQLAEKYFGSAEAAYGQMLQFSKNAHKVTGVFKNPGHSHLTINALLSLNTIPKADLENMAGAWFRVSQYTYLLLQKPEQVKTFQSKLDDFYERNIKTWVA
ncbi:MAG: ABC transporter permease, partial [Hymenobacteraceae bacterium]|nr:ABC transporter permease [Hymenobacteraceae bacterium]MDX5397859.1 ABC transporter permease [Hymenobacteraceae bacterium]MDX5513931.1 ABC transporter permease [Hymenobacteraceae bacterium]